MHSKLRQQLQTQGLSQHQLPADLHQWQQFLQTITATYQADNQRHQEINRLRRILMSLPEGLCIFNLQGDLLFCNQLAKKLLPTAASVPKNATALSLFRLRNPAEKKQIFNKTELLTHISEANTLIDSGAFLQQSDETLLPIACVISPITTQQHVTGLMLMFNDASERQQEKRDLIHAKEVAEKASEAKSSFLSSMSHELRTPMNAILGYSELLQEDLGDLALDCEPSLADLVSDLQEYSHNVHQSGIHLMSLINEMLDLTRIEAGSIELNIGNIDFNHILQDAVMELTPQLAPLSLVLDNQVSVHRQLHVMADRKCLQKVVGNLLSNAAKYNTEHGSITLTVQKSAENRLRFTVTDTGIGIKADEVEKIFQPFTRLSGLNLIEGTGIGLTLTKQLIELMDGDIGVDTDLEQGTRFWVDIPTGETGQDDAVAINTERRHLLLYIEDSRTNVSLVTKILRSRPDLALISAPTGEMGIELAKKHTPDVVLLDINLPGIDGFEVLTQLRCYSQTAHIPVLGLSADDSSSALLQAKQAGFIHYMIKPLQKKIFLEYINQLIPVKKQ